MVHKSLIFSSSYLVTNECFICLCAYFGVCQSSILFFSLRDPFNFLVCHFSDFPEPAHETFTYLTILVPFSLQISILISLLVALLWTSQHLLFFLKKHCTLMTFPVLRTFHRQVLKNVLTSSMTHFFVFWRITMCDDFFLCPLFHSYLHNKLSVTF
jgi:hypothetical protein